MSTQALLPFPCRKPRSLASKLDSVSKCLLKSPTKQESSPMHRKTLSSISNLPTGGRNPCIRSIMSQPKSPRKRFGDPIQTTEGWSNDDFLNEIFKLSPSHKENSHGDQRKHKTPTKSPSTPKKTTEIMSPTRAILSPIRALSLNSPCRNENSENRKINSKTSKVLQLKLARISIPGDDVKLPPDETPTKPVRVKGKAISFSEKKTRKAKNHTTPSKPHDNRRVTRSAKKTHKLKLFEDDYKENEDPLASSPSPSKKSKPSPEKISSSLICRSLLPPPATKPKAAKALLIESPEKVSSATSLNLENSIKKVHFECMDDAENANTQSPMKISTPRAKRVIQLHKPEALIYQQTKRALHSSVPDQLVGREQEIAKISQFITTGVNNKTSGSLYISGAPGTGKSACLMKVLENDKVTKVSSGKSKVISVNCMSMRNSTAIYTKIASELGAKSYKCKTVRSSLKFLETALTSEGPSVILLLDEMDQLDSKNQEVLYTIFEWPAMENSRLLLIGIANALDLTDRILPRLQSKSKCKPTLINFQPYTKDQIVAILEGRIKQTMVSSSSERVIDNMAVQFCARKVSAVAGDARKALDICRRAVEVVETNVKSQQILSPSKENGSKPVAKKVGMQQIAGVLSGIYESSIAAKKPSTSDEKEEEAFPLQQKLAICTLILLSRHIKCKEVTMGKLHEAYTKICKKRQVTAVGQSEFSSLLQLIETRGIVTTKATKQARMMKVSLALQEKDVEFAMQDKTLLSAILTEGLPK